MHKQTLNGSFFWTKQNIWHSPIILCECDYRQPFVLYIQIHSQKDSSLSKIKHPKSYQSTTPLNMYSFLLVFKSKNYASIYIQYSILMNENLQSWSMLKRCAVRWIYWWLVSTSILVRRVWDTIWSFQTFN